MSKVDKIIKGESIGVIINADYGGGWYSWHGVERLLYDPKIIEVLEDETIPTFATSEWIRSYAQGLYPEKHFGATALVVRWIPIGAKFRIAEYDGREGIILQSDEQWLTA